VKAWYAHEVALLQDGLDALLVGLIWVPPTSSPACLRLPEQTTRPERKAGTHAKPRIKLSQQCNQIQQ